MPSRRKFLKGLSGATAGILAGCGLADPARAFMQNQLQSGVPRAKRRDVLVGGTRVSTIDLHCHIGVTDIWKVIPRNQVVPDYLEELARKIVEIQNEKIAELCTVRSDRFVGLGTVALQDPALAVEQLEEGVKKF